MEILTFDKYETWCKENNESAIQHWASNGRYIDYIYKQLKINDDNKYKAIEAYHFQSNFEYVWYNEELYFRCRDTGKNDFFKVFIQQSYGGNLDTYLCGCGNTFFKIKIAFAKTPLLTCSVCGNKKDFRP